MFEGLDPQTIIAFGTLVSVLALIFYAFLYPVRENQRRFESELKDVKKEIGDLKAGQVKLEAGQARLEGLIKELLIHKK